MQIKSSLNKEPEVTASTVKRFNALPTELLRIYHKHKQLYHNIQVYRNKLKSKTKVNREYLLLKYLSLLPHFK